ncbi:hypothetical protein [Microbacterium hominis]|uniref:Uncharacterized protein n=1 Tax=Microbacterium hominis TaxID=162426 RepID=A0A7D4TSF8_9MICO|nr:hypothetical protein [Microbacterium hominis]QKJ20764.1 hypothetical protein HQM25_16300 [Microbacterium hominis]
MLQPLDTTGYVDDAVDGLAGANVYVSREVSGAADLASALEQQVGDASIGIAVFSENVSLEASDQQILAELAESTPYDTIIVAVGDDVFAGSRVLPSGEALRIANESEASTDSVEGALTQTVEQITAEIPGGAGGATGGIDAGVVIGVAVGVAVVLAAGGAVLGIVRARRRSDRNALPEPVRSSVARLRVLAAEYGAAAMAGTPAAQEVAAEIGGVATNTVELFERLGRRGDEAQRATAALEYGDTLRKLTGALDRDYLLDILTHPHLWDDPAERAREVRSALAEVATELVENIKQVNARRGLHFQVSLDGLIGRRKELQEWDRAFDRAADDTGPVPRAD